MTDSDSAFARLGGFIQSLDKYANPVTLTYNQKRTMQTVPGGICSLITGFSLVYYILVNIVTYCVQQTYEERSITKAIFQNQEAYEIKHNQLNLLTRIVSNDETISKDIERYVSGIYIQRSIVNGTLQPSKYYNAVDCQTLHPDYGQ